MKRSSNSMDSWRPRGEEGRCGRIEAHPAPGSDSPGGANEEPSSLLVAVHGVQRNREALLERLAPLALRHRLRLTAPLFSKTTYPDYQRMGRAGLGARADRALDEALISAAPSDAVGRRRMILFGHSGGAQFVHRYALAYPERVAAVIMIAAGWYTFPDAACAYPYGIRPSARMPDLAFRPSAFLRVPMLVALGDADVASDARLRRSARLDEQQGCSRVQRATRWVSSMRDLATSLREPSAVRLHVLPGAGHQLRDCWRAGLEAICDDFLRCEAVQTRSRP